MEKTKAVLISSGRVVAMANTTAKNGAVVSYGWDVVRDCHGREALHEIGRAKVSRAKKYLADLELMCALEDRIARVNFGAGCAL